jgi:hypothetical protein
MVRARRLSYRPLWSPTLSRLYFIDISSVPEIEANPTLKNCLPSSRSKKVTQTE